MPVEGWWCARQAPCLCTIWRLCWRALLLALPSSKFLGASGQQPHSSITSKTARPAVLGCQLTCMH